MLKKPLIKKYILHIALITLPLFSFGQSNRCTIKVKMPDMKTDGRVMLFTIDTIKDGHRAGSYTIADTIKNSVASFEVPLNYSSSVDTRIAILKLKHIKAGVGYWGYEHKQIYLQPGKIEVIVVNADSLINSKVAGAPLSVDFNEKLFMPVHRYNAAINTMMTALEDVRKRSLPDTIKLQTQIAANVKACFEVPQVYIKANPNSPVSLEALSFLGNGDGGTQITLDGLESLYNSLTPAIKNSPDGIAYAKQLQIMKDRMENQ